MQKQKNRERGITLIALVGTIIILIILAGVSISMIVGDNGIITKAQKSDELNTQAQQKEAIELAVASVQAQGRLELDRTKLETELQKQLGDTSYTLTENRDGSFLLQIAERSYYIDNTGKVITQENMIAIGSVEELKAFRDDVNSGNSYAGYYIYLTRNIDLDLSEQWIPIGIYQEESVNPNDEGNLRFEGIFDGKFYTISGINTNVDFKNRGLFGLIKNATIKNLGIVNSTIYGYSRTGAIVGYAYDNSFIKNCYNTANISCTENYNGGIAGFIKDSTIENSYNAGTIKGYMVGGITGGIFNGTIRNCYNIGSVSGKLASGISVQIFSTAVIENTYTIGNINGNNTTTLSTNVTHNYLGKFYNNYYLENTINQGNNLYIIDGVEVRSSEQLKNLANILGEAFKQDEDNINQGYPILIWQ